MAMQLLWVNLTFPARASDSLVGSSSSHAATTSISLLDSARE
jgi:hypothetical protein